MTLTELTLDMVAEHHEIAIKMETAKEIIEMLPEEKTEGILGILGTKHRNGVLNEGYNQAIKDIKQQITKRYIERQE